VKHFALGNGHRIHLFFHSLEARNSRPSPLPESPAYAPGNIVRLCRRSGRHRDIAIGRCLAIIAPDYLEKRHIAEIAIAGVVNGEAFDQCDERISRGNSRC
jgi:hypothetical protein